LGSMPRYKLYPPFPCCRGARWPSGAQLVLHVNRSYGYAFSSRTLAGKSKRPLDPPHDSLDHGAWYLAQNCAGSPCGLRHHSQPPRNIRARVAFEAMPDHPPSTRHPASGFTRILSIVCNIWAFELRQGVTVPS
jgi:hypothetical protein